MSATHRWLGGDQQRSPAPTGQEPGRYHDDLAATSCGIEPSSGHFGPSTVPLDPYLPPHRDAATGPRSGATHRYPETRRGSDGSHPTAPHWPPPGPRDSATARRNSPTVTPRAPDTTASPHRWPEAHRQHQSGSPCRLPGRKALPPYAGSRDPPANRRSPAATAPTRRVQSQTTHQGPRHGCGHHDRPGSSSAACYRCSPDS